MNTNIKSILKWTVISGLFAIPFIPFIITKSLLFPFITGKGFTFRIIIEIIFFLWALLALSDTQYRPKLDMIAKAILVFLGILLLADAFSKYPYKSFWSNYERMEGFVTIAHLVMYYFVIRAMLNTEKLWRWFWNTNLLASLFMSIYGIFQLAGTITVDQGGNRLDGTFGNATYLAIYMVFGMFIAIILAYRERKTYWKWIYGALVVLQGVMLYYTATRGSILGFIGGILLASIIVAWKERENKVARKIAGWLLAGTVGVFVIFILVRNTTFVQTSPVLSRFANLSLNEVETQGRAYVWPMALQGIAERPLLGWGQESFNYVFNKFYNPAMYNQEQWFDRTHDIALDWLINAGVLGFLAYASIYIALLYVLWKRSTFSLTEKSLITGLIAAYIFHNIFVFDNLISYISFFTVLAWVSQTGQEVSSSNGQMGVQVAKAPKQFSSETINYLFAPLALILIVASVYFINIPAIQASQTLIQGISNQSGGPQVNLDYLKQAMNYNSFGSDEVLEQLVSLSTQVIGSQTVSDDVKQAFFTYTSDQIKLKIQKTPEDARYLLLGGSFFDQVGQYDTAIPYLTSAVQYSPGKQAMYFELGSAYLGKQDIPKAFDLFQQGYNLETDNPDAQTIYAIGGIYANKPDIVQAMFQKLGQDTVANDNRIVQAYVNVKDYNSAITLLSLRLQKDPSNYNNELNLASIYATAGNKTKAIQLIQDVEKNNPSLKSQLDPYIQQLSQ